MVEKGGSRVRQNTDGSRPFHLPGGLWQRPVRGFGAPALHKSAVVRVHA